MTNPRSQIADNLAALRQRIADAALRGGRKARGVTLVAVTKYVGPREIRWLLEAGCYRLGESRPQELWEKAAELADAPIEWHLVGHLQRNKVERTLPIADLIHSVDSLRLAAAIDVAARERQVPAQILLEVNVSGEPAKHGFAPTDMAQALTRLAELQHVQVRGLMTMARLDGGRDAARGDFARLRELRDALQTGCPAGISLDELSMGMSGDFEEAVEEGATIVRVGSALFDGVMEER